VFSFEIQYSKQNKANNAKQMACASYESLMAELDEYEYDYRMCKRKEKFEMGLIIRQIFELLSANMHYFDSNNMVFLQLQKQRGINFKQIMKSWDDEIQETIDKIHKEESYPDVPEKYKILLNSHINVNSTIDEFIVKYDFWFENGMNEKHHQYEEKYSVICMMRELAISVWYTCFIIIEVGFVIYIMNELWLQFYVTLNL
jgi:hypothetical protein